jgi:hypothetical protein
VKIMGEKILMRIRGKENRKEEKIEEESRREK